MRLILVLALSLGLLAAEPDYFPLRAGMTWVYEFKGAQVFDYTVAVARVEGNRALMRTIMPQVLTMEWYQKDEQGLDLTGLEDPDGTRFDYKPSRPYLRQPLKPGTTWTWTGKLGPRGPMTDSNKILATAQVKVPAGTYTCLVVETKTTESGGELKQTSYYAAGVGLVKYVSQSKAGNWSSQLKSFSEREAASPAP